MNSTIALPLAMVGFVFLIWLFNCLNIMREYERAVVFRLGRVLKKEKGPGLVLIFWPIDKIVKVSLRVVTWDVPPQDVITRDNVSLKVNAVVYFRVISATKAIIEVENFRYAVEQAAQTSLRSVLGEVELDDAVGGNTVEEGQRVVAVIERAHVDVVDVKQQPAAGAPRQLGDEFPLRHLGAVELHVRGHVLQA